MRRTIPSLHLAFSHNIKEWLLPAGPVYNAFRPLCEKAGVIKIAFLRHGKTAPKPEKGVDFDRWLTDEGREQAREGGSSFGKELTPFYPKLLVSPAPRTMETAKLFLNSAEVDTCKLKPVQSLYDGTMQPKGSQIFKKIGYAPLRDYVENSDPEDRDVSRTLLGAYASTVVGAMTETLIEDAVSGTGDGVTLWMVGHAIYLPAAALGVAAIVDCAEAGMETILSSNTKEGEGYLIDLQKSQALYLSRPSSGEQ